MTDVKAFHESIRSGDLDGVRLSLAENPELLNAKNDAGQDAVLLSKYYGRENITAHLLALHPQLDVFTAAAIGDTAFILSELDRDATLLAAHSSDGWTPLHLAAFFGHKDSALQLLERGAKVDARSSNVMNNTPLHAAVAGRRTEVAQLLLDRGAEVDARQHGGWTPLHGAAQNGDRAIVEILLSHGAALNTRAENNQTPLDLALSNGRKDIAGLLEQLGGAPQ
jgi:uncharacterized protein